MFRRCFYISCWLLATCNAQYWKQFDPNATAGGGSFVIDYDQNEFLLDGEPFRYISGSMHYFRVPREHWQDRFDKVKAAGLNAVSTYIDWSQHEPEDGVYNFDGMLDFVSYIKLAGENGLFVILRPGPYICAERDMGGLPYWILHQHPDVILRTMDPNYIYYVDRWMGILLPLVKPLLYANGGPIITVQIENEYGSYYACDNDYMLHMRDLTELYLENNTVLFTTDGNADSFLKCGKTQGVYATVDFGPEQNVNKSFRAQRDYEPKGPLVNSEFYAGGLTHWGYAYINVSSTSLVLSLQQMLDLNASVNFYMFHGGTSFGFTNGANMGDWYNADLTSYDNRALVTECGNITEKYYAIRNFIRNYTGIDPPAIPEPIPTYAYGDVALGQVGSLFELAPIISLGSSVVAEHPLTFEALGQAYGFVLYEKVLTMDYLDPVLLDVGDIRDRGYVFVDYKFVGFLSRTGGMRTLAIKVRQQQTLSIMVENQGRLNYGKELNDFKGLLSTPILDGANLTGWKMTSLPFNDAGNLNEAVALKMNAVTKRSTIYSDLAPASSAADVPAIYTGTFVLPADLSSPRDTFLSPEGWGKGVAFINGFNLGRYWPIMGPQVTLYVPSGLLLDYPNINRLIILELEQTPCTLNAESAGTTENGDQDCLMTFLDHEILDGNTPKPYGQETSVSRKST